MTSHSDAFESLRRACGSYLGRGSDAEGVMFTAELTLTASTAGKNLRYEYRAASWDSGEILHEEDGLLGLGLDGTLTLFAASSHYRHMFPRTLVRAVPVLPADGGGTRFVFAHNAAREAFRDEITLTCFESDKMLGYAYAWGLPGNDLVVRASVTLRPIADLVDERPVNVRHVSALADPDDAHYPGDDELMAIGAPVGEKLGLERVGVHVETLPVGRRTSYPHAEKTEEELVLVLDGHPDGWLDGVLHALRPGDVVAFPPGTGLAHTFINNGPDEARLVVVGEKRPHDNQRLYPLHPEHMARIGERAWRDAPPRDIGPHDGLPDRLRESRRR